MTSHATSIVTSFMMLFRLDKSIVSILFKHPPPNEISLLFSSKSFTPKAWSIPQPPSLVALPPIPITICFIPFSIACLISCPVPYVVVINGFLSSLFIISIPLAFAISITAVSLLPKIPYEALIFSPSGFKTSVSTKTPPVEFTKASTVPSPPSAIGTFTTSA